MKGIVLSGSIRRNYTEYIVYLLILVIFLVMPLMFWDYSDDIQRLRIIGGWLRIFPFVLIFLIHNFWLLPNLLLKKKPVLYLICSLLVIAAINYFFIYTPWLHDLLLDAEKVGFPPNGMPGSVQPHGSGGHHHMHERHIQWGWHRKAYLVYAYNFFISMLVISFNTAMRLVSEWFRNEQQRKELEKENFRNKLKTLQHQVSPHFFMNTLNNIHALIDYSGEDAKDAVLRLSKMMRYLLYDTDQGTTSLRKEMEFLNSYIDLMRLRLQKSVDLKVNIPEEIPDIEVYPFLFIAFIENAFKYGIKPRGTSFIHITINFTADNLHLNVRNSKSDKISEFSERSGTGIENTRKRLDLIYGKNYTLQIHDKVKEFEIDLTLPAR